MKAAAQLLRAPLVLAVALACSASLAFAADKKDDKKAPDPKAADPKAPAAKAPDAKAADAKPATNTVPLVVEFAKATFLTAPDAGKDPFFPTSRRRFPKPVDPPRTNTPPIIVGPSLSTNTIVVPPPIVSTNKVSDGTNTVVAPPPAPVELVGSENLVLRGIIGTKTRRFATVHSGVKSYDFTTGDAMLIRLPNDKQLKVRCTEITERSVKFSVEGEPKPRELFIREGIN
jgi:hypothetical protein